MFEGYNLVEKNGEGAKLRFTDANALRAVYDKLREDDIPDAKRRARIRKVYEGNLPYNPADLEAAGLKNVTNVNFLGLKGTIDARSDVIVRLAQDTVSLVELRPLAREMAGPDLDRIGKVVAEEFSSTVREHGRFIPELARMKRESDLYGIGPVVWPSSFDWCPVALERGQLRFVGNGPVSSSSHEIFMFESTMTAGYLRFLLDNQDVAAAEGWQIPEVKKWLVDVYRNGAETKSQPGFESSTTAIEEEISRIRRNSLGEEQQFQSMYVIHAFVKEVAYPRGITHYVVPAQAPTPRFLFVRKNAYRTMDECLVWLPYSNRERYAKEVRGIASFLYPVDVLRNRFLCQVVDSGFRASSLVLAQQPGAVPSQQLTISEQGLYTVMPPGLAPTNAQFNPNFQQLGALMQFLAQAGESVVQGSEIPHVGTTGPRMFEGGSSPQGLTKAEAELQQSLRSHVDEARFAQCQDVLNKIFRESFRRFVRLAVMEPERRVDYPEVDEFISRCALRGVGLDKIVGSLQAFAVVACRDLALGADGKAQELMNFVQLHGGSIDEPGRKYIAREHARLRFGLAEADRIAPEVSRDQAPSDQASFATMENNQMKMGFEVVVGMDQWHWSHIPVHARLLQEIVEMVKAPEDGKPDLNEWNGDPQQSMQVAEQTLQNIQEDPRKVLGILVNCSQHVKEHLEIGGQQIGMEAQAKQVQKMLRDLRPTVKALNLAVATQERVEQAQREEQERAMQELQRKADENEVEKARVEADKKAETDRYRIDREHEVAMYKAQRESERGAAQDEIARRRAEGDEARRDAETTSRIDAQQRLSDARVNAANAAARFDATNQATGMSSVQPSEIAGGGEDLIGSLSL